MTPFQTPLLPSRREDVDRWIALAHRLGVMPVNLTEVPKPVITFVDDRGAHYDVSQIMMAFLTAMDDVFRQMDHLYGKQIPARPGWGNW